MPASNHPLNRILASKRPNTAPPSIKPYNPGVGAHCALPTDQTAATIEINSSIKIGHPSEGPLRICHRNL